MEELIVNPDMCLVFPDSQDRELKAQASHMDLGDKTEEYNTGVIVEVGFNLRDKDFPFKVGDWVHYRPMVGFKVHLDRKKGEKLEKYSQAYHLVLTPDSILLKP